LSERLTAAHVRAVRKAYDNLSPGEQAQIRRCREANEVLLEAAFWRVVRPSPADARPRLAYVVACFPAADQTRRIADFTLGGFLRRTLYPRRLKAGEAIRFRQLVLARDRDESLHRLRRLLVHADRPVDWGVIGIDLFYLGDIVRRRWAQDFYAPLKEDQNA
jgi:CRISPR type I-E-associated protein CasB/Cse2